MSFAKRIGRSLALLLALVLLTFTLAECHAARRRARMEREYFDLACTAALEYGVPAGLVLAVIRTESDFRADAVSPAGAKGLMQLMPETFAFLRDEKFSEALCDAAILDPAVNIRYGTYYLSYLFARFGSWSVALAAYNAGESRVAEWLESRAYSADGKTLLVIPFPETDAYVSDTLKRYREYTEKYQFHA
ncbi:MAG: lytic transglycosylase domain-containing protein [Clostridia bacterium]|nr:lytic transglycosylase domain-containing protein [Clostridia bacterium]